MPPLQKSERLELADGEQETAVYVGDLVLSYHLPFPGIGRIDANGWAAASY